LAKYPGAKLYLLHVEEDVTSQIYGPLASTAEVAAGENYLKEIAAELLDQGFTVETAVRYSRNPVPEIVRYAKELNPDLIVMGAHGHKGLKDIIFGTTINSLRHELNIPLMIVRAR
jgi:manganese transport protein